MLTKIVVLIVQTCTRFAATTVLIGLGLAVGAGFYTAQHFEINTDINKLISPDLDWRKRDIQFDKAFDQDSTIIAVVEGPTPELTASAATALYKKLAGDKEHFQAVLPLGSGEFFLLMEGVPDSFDSRYFGPVRLDAVIGRLALLWRR